jgi:transcriptional regulator with XRE-family HTH domain
LTAYSNRNIFLGVKHKSLRAAREAKGWSQEHLADETKRVDPAGAGVDQAHISKLERSEITDPKNSTVAVLEAALGLGRGTLVFGDREEVAS